MTRRINADLGPITGIMTAYGEQKLSEWEGERLFVYDDADGNKPYVPGATVIGTLTGGRGHTGPDLKPYIGKAIPQEVSDRWFREDVAEAARIVDRAVTADLTPYQRDTLISFVFNVGPGRKGVKDGFVELKKGGPSTLLRKINAGDFDAVPGELLKWVKSKGKRNNGLVNRRTAEAGLWAKGTFVASNTVVPDVPKPKPAALDMGVVATTAGSIAGVVVAAGPAIEAVKQFNEATEPTFGEYAPIVGAVVMLAAFAVIGWRVWQRRKQEAA